LVLSFFNAGCVRVRDAEPSFYRRALGRVSFVS
jgi:hypothetical protein